MQGCQGCPPTQHGCCLSDCCALVCAADVAPPGLFSCAELEAWGMCGSLNASGFCAVSCGACAPDNTNAGPCYDIATPDGVPCGEVSNKLQGVAVVAGRKQGVTRQADSQKLLCVSTLACFPADGCRRQVRQPLRPRGRLLPRHLRRVRARRWRPPVFAVQRRGHTRRRDLHGRRCAAPASFSALPAYTRAVATAARWPSRFCRLCRNQAHCLPLPGPSRRSCAFLAPATGPIWRWAATATFPAGAALPSPWPLRPCPPSRSRCLSGQRRGGAGAGWRRPPEQLLKQLNND